MLFIINDKLGVIGVLAQTKAIVSSTFSKVALHAQWRGYGARSPVYAVSFWELFLCGSCPKEKVDNRLIVAEDSGTDYRY